MPILLIWMLETSEPRPENFFRELGNSKKKWEEPSSSVRHLNSNPVHFDPKLAGADPSPLLLGDGHLRGGKWLLDLAKNENSRRAMTP